MRWEPVTRTLRYGSSARDVGREYPDSLITRANLARRTSAYRHRSWGS